MQKDFMIIAKNTLNMVHYKEDIFAIKGKQYNAIFNSRDGLKFIDEKNESHYMDIEYMVENFDIIGKNQSIISVVDLKFGELIANKKILKVLVNANTIYALQNNGNIYKIIDMNSNNVSQAIWEYFGIHAERVSDIEFLNLIQRIRVKC